MVVFDAAKKVSVIRLAMALVVLLAGFVSACETDDLYAPCELQGETINENERACAEDAQACVIKNFLRCETRMCGKYYKENNDFCTIECESDSVCGNGRCIEFLPGTGEKYCVSNSILNSK